MCPSCGQDAPLVYKGVSAFCFACGKPRTPLTASAVNFRGKPAKIGGTLASFAGWLLLFGALVAALIVGAIFQAIFPAAILGWVLGGVIAVVGVVVSLLLLFGGRALKRSGMSAARAAQLDALGSLASYQHGVITVQMASESLGLPLGQADAFLTSLAKQPDSGVTLEVDDDGKITYRFARYAPPSAWPAGAKLRVDDVKPAIAGDTMVVRAPAAREPPRETEIMQVDDVAIDPRRGRS
jgi:hypothetical protein